MNKSVFSGARSFVEVQERIDRTQPSTFNQSTVISHLIKYLWKRIEVTISNQLSDSGLNSTSFFTLMMLYGSSGESTSPSELSYWAGETRTNMTRIASELERKKLIQRAHSQLDRRCVDLMLTPQGKQKVESIMPRLQDSIAVAFSFLSEQEHDQLERLLKKLLMV